MGIRDKVLSRAKRYIESKNYNLDLVDRNKINKTEEVLEVLKDIPNYEMGDRVKLLDEDEFAIIYEGVDKFNNVKVLYNEEIIDVNIKRISLNLKAIDLYPRDNDLNSLFISYKERKLEKDIKRGSKKALKKIQKDIKSNRL